MGYLLGITIGPVQTYIEESRKLIDLKNSSNLISSIMKKIYRLIPDSAEKELIYPNHSNFNEDENFSNYMIIETKNIVKMRNIGKKAFDYFDNFLHEIDPEFSIRNVLNLFWSIKENDDLEKSYYNTYEELTRDIRSLKNTYEFEQQEQSGGEKCLICGKYNYSTNVENRKYYNLGVDELLCPLCLFKRKGIWNEKDECKRNFESVYSLALMKWKEENENAIKIVTDQLNKIFKKNIDKYYRLNEINSIIKLLKLGSKDNKKFREFQDDIKKKYLASKNSIQEFENIKKCMSDLYNKKDKKGNIIVKSPVYEYSFIQMDVDNLGKWMSGKYINSDNIKDLKEYQQFISGLLLEFGRKLKNQLNKNYCEVIYSGGDDFLAVLPNEEIINVSETIDELFKEEVQNKIKNQYKEIDRNITYSISITITQCKDPMSYALNKTRMELDSVKKRFEKNNVNKNGVVINYIVNNGKEITCYITKSKFKVLLDLVEKFDEISKYVSFSYINNFESEMSKFNFKDMSYFESQTFFKMAEIEFNRIFHRSLMMSQEDKKNKKLVSKIEAYINSITRFMVYICGENHFEIKSNLEYVDFSNIMNIFNINKKLCMIKQ